MKKPYYSGERATVQLTAESVDVGVPQHILNHAFKGLLYAGFTHDELSQLSAQEIMEKYGQAF